METDDRQGHRVKSMWKRRAHMPTRPRSISCCSWCTA